MRRFATLLSAVALCVTACAAGPTPDGSVTSGPSLQPRFHGSWLLTEVVDGSDAFEVPPSAGVYLTFAERQKMRGFDGCAHFDGELQTSSGGSMTAVDVSITANGCNALGLRSDKVRKDIDIAFYRRRPIKISISKTKLTVATGQHLLTYQPQE